MKVIDCQGNRRRLRCVCVWLVGGGPQGPYSSFLAKPGSGGDEGSGSVAGGGRSLSGVL
jgi:hypothetical protein